VGGVLGFGVLVWGFRVGLGNIVGLLELLDLGHRVVGFRTYCRVIRLVVGFEAY
jgi:hypothetical protein